MSSTDESTDEKVRLIDQPLVRPLWARVLVVAVLAVAGMVVFYQVMGVPGASPVWPAPGPVPEVSASSPFPSGAMTVWVGTYHALVEAWILWILVLALVAAVVVLLSGLLVHPLSDYLSPASVAAAPPMIVAVLLVMVVVVDGMFVPDGPPERQQQAAEVFTSWAQDRYGVDLSGLDEGVVLDLMDGDEAFVADAPVLLGDGQMVDAYESHGLLVLTHGGGAEELEVVVPEGSGASE